MRRIMPAILLVCFMGLAGCNDGALLEQPGADFVGRWRSESYSLNITRNGDSFIVVMLRNAEPPREFPATLDGGVLTIANGFGGVPISYVKVDDTLLTDGKRFTRLE